MDRLGHAVALSVRRGSSVAVLSLDLDGFKAVNDSYGHEAGDLLLVGASQRLRECIRPEDTAARFGGDEFVVLLEDVKAADEASAVAERIMEKMRTPFALDGRGATVSASIGIGLGSGDERPEDLLRDADSAMYAAKEEGKNRHKTLDQRTNRIVSRRAKDGSEPAERA